MKSKKVKLYTKIKLGDYFYANPNEYDHKKLYVFKKIILKPRGIRLDVFLNVYTKEVIECVHGAFKYRFKEVEKCTNNVYIVFVNKLNVNKYMYARLKDIKLSGTNNINDIIIIDQKKIRNKLELIAFKALYELG